MIRKIQYFIYHKIIILSRSNGFFRFVIDIVGLIFYKLFRRNRKFKFNNFKYRYFYHYYNRTIAGERVVEIPIAKKLIDEYNLKNILEVGNVMSHYFKIKHQVLDKYEKGYNVLNEDVVTFNFKNKYDLILSISTLEHVGYSYGEKWEPKKFDKAVLNLKKGLKKGGVMFVTFPVFLNPRITELIQKNKMPFTKSYYMKRISFLNDWKQVNRKEALAKNVKYDSYFANANILYFGYYKK